MALARDIHRFTAGVRVIGQVMPLVVLVLISQRALAEVTQPALAQIVKKAIKDDSVLYDPPRVSVNGQKLNYHPGKIFYPDYANKPVQALGFPVDVQFKVELIRKHRGGEKAELAFLQPYLRRMEKVVSDELALIAKHKGSQQDLVKQLSEQDDRARAILAEGIRNWAKQQGLGLAKPGAHYAAVIPAVTFRTVPAGGTVYYLNAVDYNVNKSAGLLDEMDRWNQVPGQQMDMGGAFYFRAAWPGGKNKRTAKILINENRTISIAAD